MAKALQLCKTFLLLVLAFALMGFSACGTQDREDADTDGDGTSVTPPQPVDNSYEIKVIDGQYYMQFRDYSRKSIPGLPGCEVQELIIGGPSIGELKRKIEEHDFTDREFNKIKAFPRSGNGIRIFPLDHCFDPVLPDGISVQWIGWFCDRYYYSLGSENGLRGEMFVSNTGGVISGEHEEDYLKKYKSVKYCIEEDGRYVQVYEYYKNISEDDSTEVWDTVPYYVHVYESMEDSGYVLELARLNSRPSTEWILSFGLQAPSD